MEINLQSLLGYSKGSPYADSPFLNISTPAGLIDMSNTPIDLLGIDNKGNKKKMKAGRKNPYKFEGDQVTEIPLQKGNPYQRGGLTAKQMFDFIFDDEEETPKKQSVPTAPSTEEIETQEPEIDESYNTAMEIATSEFFKKRGNPYKTTQSGFIPEKVDDKAGYAYQFFIEKGYSPEIAAGIVGNIKHESNFDVSAVGDAGKAKGLVQWHPDRYGKLSSKFDLQSFDGNLEAIDYELKTSERFALQKITQARSPEEAAALVDKYFERSAGRSTKQRMNTAKNIYNIYGSSR